MILINVSPKGSPPVCVFAMRVHVCMCDVHLAQRMENRKTGAEEVKKKVGEESSQC